MKTSAFLLAIGAALFGYALTLQPYNNEKLFMEQYMRLSAGQSEEYWKLRDEMLTPKFKLQDYGITLASIAAAVLLVARNGKPQLQTPKSRKVFIALAILLPLLTVTGYVFDLLQAADRGEFPHWADSLGIPLAGAPFLFISLFIWSLAHLGFLRGTYKNSTPLVYALSFKANKWLLFVSVMTALVTAQSVAFGQYWYAIPGIIWLYFYISLGAIRRAAYAT